AGRRHVRVPDRRPAAAGLRPGPAGHHRTQAVNEKTPMPIPHHRRRCNGFTILEMSVVLVVIALIIGAVSVGRDVYRSAVAERISTEFVQGWIVAYDRYVAQVGTVPLDNLANPTGRVRAGSTTPLCDTASTKEL